MKTMQESKIMNAGGFTLLEVLIVIIIISILLAITGIVARDWVYKYNAESQIRMLHADLLQTRVKAMEKNKQYFVSMNAGSYQIIEDSNENGVIDTPGVDTYTYQTAKTLNYTPGWTGTIIMDTRGLISTNPASSTLSISFNTPVKPEYDCLQVSATRINIGRMNGANCVPR